MKNIIFAALISIFLAQSTSAAERGSTEMRTTLDRTARQPKVFLALGGGGTRGVAHIGVLRVLSKAGVPIDGVVGTSMGAIVGGLFCAGMPIDRIQTLMEDKKLIHAYYTVPIPLRIGLIPILFVPRLFGYHPYNGLYRGNKFAHFVDKEIPEGSKNIEDLPIPFAAVASDLLSGKAFIITKGNLGRAIQASSAVPVLRRPVEMDGKLLVDGGIEANVPVIQAKSLGADIVIAVDVDETFTEEPEAFRKILSVGNRVASMILDKIDEPQVNSADILIRPDVNGIHLLSNRRADGYRAIDAGTKATQNALPSIFAKLKDAGIELHKP